MEATHAVEEPFEKTETSRRKPILIAVAVVLVLAIAGAIVWALWPQPEDPGEALSAPSLELRVDGVPGPVDVGIVVSYTEDPNQGAGWDMAGEGANIAAWRLGLGGVDVRLHLVSDKGSEQGARDAMDELKSKGVAGVVALTSGSHTSALAEQASVNGLPIIFPYEPQDPKALADGAWFFTPEPDDLAVVMDRAAQDSGCLTAIAAHEAGREPLTRSSITTAVQVGKENEAALEVARLAMERGAECVVAETNPETLARLILALRGQDVELPVIASWEALNPAFIRALDDEATAVGGLTAPGFASPITLTMSSGGSGARAGAFIQARDVMSRDETATSLDGTKSFGEAAFFADAPSHDALLALVRAAGIARSTDPADVSEALTGLELDDQAGLVLGPASFISSLVILPEATHLAHSILVNDQLAWFPPEYEDN